MAREIILDPADPATGLAPITNMHAYFKQLLKVPGVLGQEGGGLFRWLTGIPVAWFNGLLAERPAREGDQSIIKQNIAYFQSQNKTEMSWWFSPYIPSGGWERLLSAQGFTYRDEDPGMRIDLAKLPDLRLPTGLRLARVTSESENRIWVEQNFRGFGNPRNLVDEFYNLMVGMGLDWPLRNYLAYIGEQPVASSTLFLGAGTAGVYYVSTQDEYRGRGIGTALTIAPLMEARDMGYRVGVLQASKMGYPVYKKIGFEATCNNGYYFLSLSPAEGRN
jgi:GNAT superfamily N-acetyltransferase